MSKSLSTIFKDPSTKVNKLGTFVSEIVKTIRTS